MPKLNKKDAEAVNKVEAAGGFEPLPPGLYPVRLLSVEARQGDKGPYWVWEYEIPEGFDHEGRRFWNNTSLSEASRPFFKQTFDAFGVPTSTDTDELMGCWVTLRVGTRTIQKGERAGELANTVTTVMPFDAAEFERKPGYGDDVEEPF